MGGWVGGGGGGLGWKDGGGGAGISELIFLLWIQI